MLPYADLFLMGAAFLLLETKNVVQFALLFGTTWFVNALVFGGILVVVLAAIEVARPSAERKSGTLAAPLRRRSSPRSQSRGRSRRTTCSISPGAFGCRRRSRSRSRRSSSRTSIFAERFRDVGASTVAFGANLLGAMVGGLLEYTAILVGYRSLLLLTAALYAGAFVAGPLRPRARLAARPAAIGDAP